MWSLQSPRAAGVHADAWPTVRGADKQTRGIKHPVRGHLLGVGPVPEDGVAVGHHFGTGLLAKYTHQQRQAEEDDHFHLQHHYGETSARIPLRRRVGRSVGSCGGASTGTGDARLIHLRGRWRCLSMPNE